MLKSKTGIADRDHADKYKHNSIYNRWFHLVTNNLLNPHHTAYIKHVSTETVLLYIHARLINRLFATSIPFILNLTTATHCTIIFHSLRWKKTPEHPELSCSCCHQNAKIFSYTSPVLKSLEWLKINESIKYKFIHLIIRFSQQSNLNIFTIRNLVTTHVLHLWSLASRDHLPAPLWKSLCSVCCTLSMERTPHWSSRASSDTVSCSSSYHTWQCIIFTTYNITACISCYSFSISFWTQGLALRQIISSIDLFPSYRTDSTDSRTI